MSGNLIKRAVFSVGILISLFFSISQVFASFSIGVIDPVYKYAWGENIGWINFNCDSCKVSVTDNAVTGYAWNKQYGWINLNPVTSGVKNDGEGNLSGMAWGKNIGWIDFSGVVIQHSGSFTGYATVKHDNSKINFNCIDGNSCGSSDFKVHTDWMPANLRPVVNNGGGGGGGGGRMPPPNVVPPTVPPVVPPVAFPTLPEVVSSVAKNVSIAINSVYDSFVNFFKPEPVKVIVTVPKIAPLSLNTAWILLPVKAINAFVFAPLPYEISVLASKFPELGNTFKSVGVERFTDIGKLTDVTLHIPGLTAQLSKTIKDIGVENLNNINNLNGVSLDVSGLSNLNNLNNVGLNVPGLPDINSKIPTGVPVSGGNIALIPGLPVADFSLADKKNLPSEFVFARVNNELVDLNVALSLNDQGKVVQRINTLPGRILNLVVKPISKARSVTGYFVFESATPRVSTTNSISRASLTASALFSMNGAVEQAPAAAPIEQKFVLSSFQYTDPNHDGIYTADVASPTTPGTYQIVTVIDYIDPTLGARQMVMTAVIDPEGYVYEKNGGKETRIPSAIVSLFYLNLATKQYELWPAKKYQQENPQITDVRGTYSFLVPEGSYYFEVVAPGYKNYQSKVFVAVEGGGVHQNIELTSSGGWLSSFDWKTALLIVVLLLLVYNLLRDSLRNGLLKFLKKNDGK